MWLLTQGELETSLNAAETEVRQLERALAVADDRHRADLASLRAVHRGEVERWTRTVNSLEADRDALRQSHADIDRRMREERRLSDAAWNRVALLGALADHPDMPPHLAEQIRTVGERVQQIKENAK